MEYLISLIVICIIPSFIILFYRRELIKPILIGIPFALILGTIWDYIAISRKWWSYENVIGIYFLKIPIEDYLFFIFVPIMCVCVYDSIRRRIKKG